MDKKSKGKKPTCFVPECSNIVGVLFPRTADAKKKWLESLKIKDKQPERDSFVCLDHFEDGEAAGGRERGGKKPLPKRKIVKNNDKTKNTDKEENISRPTQSTEKSKKGEKTKTQANTIEKPKTRSASQKSTELTEAEIDKELQKLFENDKFKEYPDDEGEKTVDSQKNKVSQKNNTEDITNTCRLCMENKGGLESIYSKLDDKHTIIHAMIVCLFPLKITPGDKLSKKICKKCLANLKDFFKFRLFCLEMDKKQQKYRGIEFDYYSDDSDVVEEDWEEEFELPEAMLHQSDKKKGETQQEKDVSRLQSGDASTKDQSHKINNKMAETTEELLRVLEGDRSPHKAKIQQELKKISKSQSGSTEVAEADSYENITIDIVQDENEDTSGYKLTSSKLPIIIKPVNQTNRPQARKRKSDSNTSAVKCPKLIKTSEDEVIIMPKDIKVKMVTVADRNVGPKVANTAPDIVMRKIENEYTSGIGMKHGVVIAYLLDSEFFDAEDYIYEFRLTKEEGRNLTCLSPDCAAEAFQRKTNSNTFSNEINLMIPHNHQPFTPEENKTLMFYNVLRRNMQKNKSYNFRTLYEDLVRLDPSLWSIIPLAGVIDGLCKYCPVPEIPRFDTFDDLFDLIEEKCFYKIHFTTSGEQFYQDKFECHDGSKAIIFANQEKINNCSYSKLMYVDTSFQIMKDVFSYQLVTVLAWVHDTFHPIMYAFINQQSEDIFRIIFAFLYNNLAPCLRPDEIITEFDADVYYALAETYVESKIGGSFFSYFQNIYKATCALNLAGQLESNPSFRSMYYMLLMLPLLPPTTIANAFFNIEGQIEEAGLLPKMKPLLQYYTEEWLDRVTPEFFCVHRLESRTFNNLVAPFKKLKSLVVSCKTRARHPTIIVTVLEKLVDLEFFLQSAYALPSKQWARDMHVSQKRMVLKAWHDIDENPKIKLFDFQQKVLGYLKCVENQLWIWGCYGIEGPLEINLINAAHFSFAPNETEEIEESQVEYCNVTEETTEEATEGASEETTEEATEENTEEATAETHVEEVENSGEFEMFDVQEPEHADQNGDSVVVEAVIDDATGRLREENSQFLKFN